MYGGTEESLGVFDCCKNHNNTYSDDILKLKLFKTIIDWFDNCVVQKLVQVGHP